MLRHAASEHRCAHSRLRNVQVHAQAEETTEEGALADDDVCELVSGFDVEISGDAEDEGFSGYFIKALKNNNGAGVLLLSDVYGYESSGIRDFVYRLACVGYKYASLTLIPFLPFLLMYQTPLFLRGQDRGVKFTIFLL